MPDESAPLTDRERQVAAVLEAGLQTFVGRKLSEEMMREMADRLDALVLILPQMMP